MGSVLTGRAGAVAAALVIDRVLGEPPARLHPVVWFGTLMTAVEGLIWADRRAPGIAYTALGVGVGVGAGAAARSATAALTIAVAGRELDRAARRVERCLDSDDLEGARRELPALVGRDPSELDASAVAAAVVESLAENTVDAVIGPAFWTLAFGAPGAAGYRAVNTLDAMVGHRSDRYERFGWASARLDDLANWVPARLFALLVVAAAPNRAEHVVRTIRRDAGAHPSPNGGVAEAAVAAALGVEVGGPLRYGTREEIRPRLGTGPRPGPGDIAAARRLTNRTQGILAAFALVLAGLHRYRSRHRGQR